MIRTSPVSLVLLLSLLTIPTASALQFTTGGPIGELALPAVTLVAVSPAAPNVVYAGAADGKLYRSTDDGSTWTALSTPASSVSALTVDPANSATVYIVGQMNTYRSDDSGETWKDLTPRIGTLLPASILVDPQNPATVYIASRCGSYTNPFNGGIHKSADHGDTWTTIRVQCVDYLSLDRGSPQRLFTFFTTGDQQRSNDGGRSWRSEADPVPIFDVVVDPLDPSRHYGIGRGRLDHPPALLRFLVSSDAGATWSVVAAEGLPSGALQLAIDPVTRRLFLAGSSYGLFVSDDLGRHWTHLDSVPVAFGQQISMAAARDVLYIATPQGLYRAPMASPEEAVKIPLGEATPLRVIVYRIALDPNDASTLYATALEGLGSLNAYRVFRSRNSGRTWERITPEDDTTKRLTIAVDAAGDLYAAGTGTMWRFAIATQTWETWDVPELGFAPTILLANPQRAGWLYAANAGSLRYSTDGGHTWTTAGNVGGLLSMAIAPNGNDLVGGNDDGVYASSDGGVTWRALPAGHLMTTSVAIAPSRPSTIYRLTNTAAGPPQLLSGLFRSDDAGITWTLLRWPGEHDSSAPLTVDPRDDRSVWIGFRHSTDGGVTWATESTNTPYSVLSVAFDRNGDVLYALTSDYAVWQATVRAVRRRATSR